MSDVFFVNKNGFPVNTDYPFKDPMFYKFLMEDMTIDMMMQMMGDASMMDMVEMMDMMDMGDMTMMDVMDMNGMSDQYGYNYYVNINFF